MMKIIISPAKKMRADTDSLPADQLPRFLPEAQRLLDALRALPPQELKSLWKCNDSIAALNMGRLQTMDLQGALTPALLSYDGIQYQYLAPGVMTVGQLEYLQAHLRILSGFYGLLRPFDRVVPYRLEMQAKLRTEGFRDLYGFWGDKLARALKADTLVNLASKEYSRAVLPYVPAGTRVLTCVFAQERDGKLLEKGTLCKMARGQMVRWMAENNVTQIDKLKRFSDLGYTFIPERSDESRFVFLKG